MCIRDRPRERYATVPPGRESPGWTIHRLHPELVSVGRSSSATLYRAAVLHADRILIAAKAQLDETRCLLPEVPLGCEDVPPVAAGRGRGRTRWEPLVRLPATAGRSRPTGAAVSGPAGYLGQPSFFCASGTGSRPSALGAVLNVFRPSQLRLALVDKCGAFPYHPDNL